MTDPLTKDLRCPQGGGAPCIWEPVPIGVPYCKVCGRFYGQREPQSSNPPCTHGFSAKYLCLSCCNTEIKRLQQLNEDHWVARRELTQNRDQWFDRAQYAENEWGKTQRQLGLLKSAHSLMHPNCDKCIADETPTCHIRPHDFCSAGTCSRCVDAARYQFIRSNLSSRKLAEAATTCLSATFDELIDDMRRLPEKTS